jgi:hypothetical protein
MTIRSGDPQPYIDCWADPDVTLFEAWGPIERGYQALTSTFRGSAAGFTGYSGGGVENAVVWRAGPGLHGRLRARSGQRGRGPGRDMVIG